MTTKEKMKAEINQLKLLLKEQKELGIKSTVNINWLHNTIVALESLSENV